MDKEDFRKWSRHAADWGVDYRSSLRNLPVRPALKPGYVRDALPPAPPETAEPMEAIFADFEKLVVPAMTHWQHPRFFAYFPANAAPASVVAEHLVNNLAAQCMLWQTSPAATEVETRMMDWLRQAIGLPSGFQGVIQDSASSATLAAVLIMRERSLAWASNKQGLSGQKTPRVYASGQVHTSIDRAIWISGIGADNLVRIPVSGALRAMDAAALEQAIIKDKAAGFLPAGIIACVGGTSVGATDDIAAVCAVAKRHNLYVHVDAAWAGSAMICPEFRDLWSGIEEADSIVFNPHKWLGAQFDCSAHFLKNAEDLVRTLAIQPEYLKTHGVDGIINYSEWSVPLGRRFRALKIWFLLRAYGLEGLRGMIRNHVTWSQSLAKRLAQIKDIRITSEPMLSLFSFRHEPAGVADLDAHNLALVNAINDDGRIYLTQTRLDGQIVIRFQAGAFDMEERDADAAHEVIAEFCQETKT
ncbi:MAG: aspartate aminotransferase family protein [Phyllobacteriaceae bacterium]|nr:aspartate aminotransferase family protein [Phyllobacteriaceae bacterium]